MKLELRGITLKRPKFSGSPVLGKLAAIAILTLLLLIPKSMVMDVIQERTYRRDEAKREVSDKWGGSQVLNGPILVVPYQITQKVEDEDDKGKVKVTFRRVLQHAYFLPERLHHEVSAETQVRYRGLFEVILYQAKVGTKGRFGRPTFERLSVAPEAVFWNKAKLVMGISDIRGIQKGAALTWNGARQPLDPGPASSVVQSGIHADLNLSPRADGIEFEFRYVLNGAEDLKFVPVGKETSVEFSSPWPSPSFQGSYLPNQRKVGKDGFNAKWEIPHLARNFPQRWTENEVDEDELQKAAFGANFLLPVDSYQTTIRSAKYGVLFLTMTFLIFFLFEVLAAARIHPLQYLLVGFALLLFYVLLLALSEYMVFGLAYLLASVATVGLITAYSSSVLWDLKKAKIIGALLAFLYAYLYCLLKAEDYALLLGSIGLFVTLAVVMYATRGVDWYSIGQQPKGPPRRKA